MYGILVGNAFAETQRVKKPWSTVPASVHGLRPGVAGEDGRRRKLSLVLPSSAAVALGRRSRLVATQGAGLPSTRRDQEECLRPPCAKD